MRKVVLVAIMVSAIASVSFAGGLLTNTNQSAQFVRMLSRNASTQIDAVYFNPAGLMLLENGWHIAVNNQSIWQTRSITTQAPLNNKEFEGNVTAPLFPSAFAVYKTGNVAFSLGFGPNGGGGSAEYPIGLPSFEGRVASQVNNELVPALAGLSAIGYNVQPGYDAGISFKGQSVFWGLQLGVSARVSDAFSAYAGVRYLPSKNTYTGSIENISMKVNGQLKNAKEFLTEASGTASTLAGQASAAATNFTNGAALAGQLPPADPVTNQTLAALLTAIGQNPAQLNNGTAQVILNTAATTYAGQAAQLNQTAQGLAATAPQLSDIEVDTDQTGAGWTPIIGFNIQPVEKLNIGLKYEHKTILTLQNDTRKSDANLDFLKDKQKIPNDLPGIISVGVGYSFTKQFQGSLSYTGYLDKGVNWGNNIYGQKRVIDKNSSDLALGLQYNFSEKFGVSIGGMQSTSGVSEDYQSDFSYSNSSNTGAFGLEWKVTNQLTFDAGMLFTVYKDAKKSFGSYSETYDKANIAFGFGLAYSIF